MKAVRAVVLAAGKGTRMKSARPKVFHEVCGRPMLWWVVHALREAGVDEIVIVVSPEMRDGTDTFGARSVVQQEQRGTGHALRIALEAIEPKNGATVLVANGDMPLVTTEIFLAVMQARGSGAMSLATLRTPSSSGFGRVVRDGEHVARIVEVRDATSDELEIEESNAGIYAIDEAKAREVVTLLHNENAQGEFYLTDTVELLAAAGEHVTPLLYPLRVGIDLLGVNDRTELAQARSRMNARLCAQHMLEGVTIIDPATTYLEPELTIGRDTVIYPNSSIGRLSVIGEGCTIGPNARLSHATIGARAEVRESVILDSSVGDDTTVGPYAHVRGDSALGESVRVGNFVEIKHSTLARGAKVSHLSYVGDATIGEDANIGAGTITCNFDGKQKNRTTIGKRVMIGSNSSLIAPVEIGDDALTGAGSVVTKDVPPGGRVAGNPAKPLPKRS